MEDDPHAFRPLGHHRIRDGEDGEPGPLQVERKVEIVLGARPQLDDLGEDWLDICVFVCGKAEKPGVAGLAPDRVRGHSLQEEFHDLLDAVLGLVLCQLELSVEEVANHTPWVSPLRKSWYVARIEASMGKDGATENMMLLA